ncbi:MAG TPA: hypothetical protein VGO07_02490 [Candidatus Saccharimonadales bacterium]|nr:hypothetical protein [Candidatus Saccharimonadales bacterium]
MLKNFPITQEEQPLPAYMVAALAAPVKQMLAVQYDVQPPRSVENDNHARIPYRTARARIENQTIPQPVLESDEDTGLSAARTYVVGLIREAYSLKKPNAQIVGIPYFKDESNAWRFTIDTTEGPEEIELEKFLAPLFDKMYGPADYRLPDVEKVAYRLAQAIFKKSAVPYNQLLDDAVRRTFGTDGYPVALALKGPEPYWVEELHAGLKKPSGDAISHDQYCELIVKNRGKDHGVATGFEITMSTKEQADALRAIKIGTVKVPLEYNGTQMRVMTRTTRDRAISDRRIDTGTPLIITLENMMYSDKDPFIPGFKLVSRRNFEYATEAVIYEFMPSAEGDPYADCHVQVPAEGVTKLVEAYEYLGMPGLVAKVKANTSLTVNELKRYIMQESRYIYPEHGSGWGGGDEQLGMFKGWVENGKFETQCSGAAFFMKCSIDTAFGHGNAMVIAGDTVPMSSTRLDKARHNQVSVNLEGRNYIVDATPGIEGLSLTTRAPKSAGRAALTEAPPVASRYFKMMSADLQVKSAIIDGRHAIEEELLHVFKAADTTALYDKLVRLSDEDPILRAVRCMYEASKAMAVDDRQELGQTLDVLSRLIANDNPEAVRNLGWSRYSPGLLGLIAQELGRLQNALNVQDELIAAG